MMNDMDEIQRHWEKDEVFGLDSFLFRDGRYKRFDLKRFRNFDLKSTFGYEYELGFRDSNSLYGIPPEQLDSLWVETQINCSVKLNDNQLAVAGEGGMGNEGFIAMLDGSSEVLWTLFSSETNPFVELAVRNSLLLARSTHNFWIAIETSKVDLDNLEQTVSLTIELSS